MASRGRPSTVAGHPERRTIEAQLSTGVPISIISGVFPELSERTLYRARAAMRESYAVEHQQHEDQHAVILGTVAGQLADVAQDMQRARREADAAGDRKGRVSAGRAEIYALEALSTRIGITETEAPSMLADAHAVIVGLRRALPDLPREVSQLIRDRVAAAGASYRMIDDFEKATKISRRESQP